MAGCSSGHPPGGATDNPSSAPTATPEETHPAAAPGKVYTDQELMAIINAVAQNRKVQGGAQDSQRLRSVASAGSPPGASTQTTPGGCAVFGPQSPFAVWADKSVNMAEGAISIADQSGPTTTVMLRIRSAEKNTIAKADFNYSEDLASRCGTFDMAHTESGTTSTYAIRLLAAPPVGDTRFASMQTTKPRGPQDLGSVGLRVLAGTMSITLSLSVDSLNSDADAHPALVAMAGLAQQLIGEAMTNPPSVAAAPPNSRTPDDLVVLLKSITGPNGNAVGLPSATVIGSAPPGANTGVPSQAPPPPCTYSDASSLLPGATIGQGQIPGAGKMDSIDLTVVSMPITATQPYPFDSVAAALRGCATIQEDIGGSTRPWSGITHPKVSIAADTSFAVAYQLSDGTGERHVFVGARKGTLFVQASVIKRTDADVQAGGDGLAAVISQVFAKAGL